MLAFVFNISLAPVIVRVFQIRIVLLSSKGRLSLFNSYVEGELRKYYYWRCYQELKKTKIIFINPYEIPNKYLLGAYSAHAKFICLNLHLHTGFRNQLLVLLLKILQACAKDDGLISMGKNRHSPHESFLWSLCNPVLDNLELPPAGHQYNLLESSIDLTKPYCLLAYRQTEYYKKHVNLARNPQSADPFSFRNPEFLDYIPFINWLIDQDIQVIRMGCPSDPIQYTKKGFYDFSGLGYSDALDIYLARNCMFLISGACGYYYQASIFNKPIFSTHDYSLLNGLVGMGSVSLPSKYMRNGKSLTLRESLAISLNDPLPAGVHLEHPSAIDILETGQRFVRSLKDKENLWLLKKTAYEVAHDYSILGNSSFDESWLTKNAELFN